MKNTLIALAVIVAVLLLLSTATIIPEPPKPPVRIMYHPAATPEELQENMERFYENVRCFRRNADYDAVLPENQE